MEKTMINYDYVRNEKKVAMERWYNVKYDENHLPKHKSYNKATILPLKMFPGDDLLFGRGGVVDEAGNYIVESGITDRIEKNMIFHIQNIGIIELFTVDI